MIVKRKDGYHVVAESLDAEGNRKNLGGPYSTWGEAKNRLDQVEMFKAMGEAKKRRTKK